MTRAPANKRAVADAIPRLLAALQDGHDWDKKTAAAGTIAHLASDASIAAGLPEGAVDAVFDVALSCTDACKEQLVGVLRNCTPHAPAREAIASRLGLARHAPEHDVDAALLAFRRGALPPGAATYGLGFSPAYEKSRRRGAPAREDLRAAA